MSDKIEFVLELTREEAVMLSMITHSNTGHGRAARVMFNITTALEKADPKLHGEQFDLWALSQTHFALRDNIDEKQSSVQA